VIFGGAARRGNGAARGKFRIGGAGGDLQLSKFLIHFLFFRPAFCHSVEGCYGSRPAEVAVER
jgi:hypothetical protein